MIDDRNTNSEDLAAIFLAKLKNITQLQGYRTDIGLTVFDGRRQIEPNEIPCSIFHEGEDRMADDDAKVSGMPKQASVIQHYVFEGITGCDPKHPNIAARAIVADLKKAIFATDDVLRRKIIFIRYTGKTFGAREGGTTMISAAIQIDVSYISDLQAN